MILDEIAEKTRARIKEKEKTVPLGELKEKAEGLRQEDFRFGKALRREGISFICEVKKASPSKGLIAEDFPYVKIAEEYEAAGAAAISCLTEPYFFQGKEEYLSEIASAVRIPVLRKDFTVSPYMIYEAKLMGASAVLLICAILDDRELAGYLELSHTLGLSALVEAHTENEVRRALASGAEIIGVNNRNLKTFEVDISTAVRLRKLVPPDKVFVAESGIRTAEDIRILRESGVDAVLVGETLMRAPDKKKKLAELAGRAGYEKAAEEGSAGCKKTAGKDAEEREKAAEEGSAGCGKAAEEGGAECGKAAEEGGDPA